MNTTMKLKCNKCGKENPSGAKGHIGKKHKGCFGRKKGSGKTKKNCGVWA